MLHAASLGIGNREEHARVVGFLNDASTGPYRQTTLLLNLVYHFHRLAPPPVRYPLYSRWLQCAPLTIRQLAHSLPPKPTSAVAILRPTETIPPMDRGRAPWAARRHEAEQRKARRELLYDLETEFRKIGWGNPAFVHDEEKGLFRFRDGHFAFSREHADWALLKKRGRLKGWATSARTQLVAGAYSAECVEG